jgi:hypothetical protein
MVRRHKRYLTSRITILYEQISSPIATADIQCLSRPSFSPYEVFTINQYNRFVPSGLTSVTIIYWHVRDITQVDKDVAQVYCKQCREVNHSLRCTRTQLHLYT